MLSIDRVYIYIYIYNIYYIYIYIIYIYIYIYMSREYDSVGQPKASKPEVPSTTLGSSCFSLVFIKNLINDK